MSADGLNATVEGLSALHGWDAATLLGFSTLSGLISIAGMFVFGLVCHKIGARLTAVIGLVLGGLSYIWYGHVASITQYAIALCLVSLFVNVHAWIAGGAYLSSWFPKKKGLALGWATMGNNFASAFIVLILTRLADLLGGIQWAITVVGAASIVTALWAFFVPDTPEQAGAMPDNAPPSNEPKHNSEASDADVSDWTFGRLLSTKQFWLISFGLGIYMLVTVGVMSQLVPRLIGQGFSQTKAINSMTVCALIGVVGSYAWGVVDQKLTTRVATALFGIWYALAIIANLISGTAFTYISLFMLGVAIGGNANWPASLTSTVFGHRNFAMVYSIINPAISVMRMLSFVALAISLRLTGSYSSAYVVFVILAFFAALLIWLVNDKQYAS
jgi:sugar phosphate permease